MKFLRIKDRGLELVAVFDRGYPVTWWGWMNNQPLPMPDDGTFCLNEEDLRARIANVEREGRDASVERHALTTLTEVAYHKAAFPGG